MWPTSSRCSPGGMPRSLASRMSRPGVAYPVHVTTANRPTSPGREARVVQRAGHRLLAQRQRLLDVALHPGARAPAAEVLVQGIGDGVPASDPGAGEDPPGGAHALVVPGEVALPDGVLVQRRREGRPGSGDDGAAHPAPLRGARARRHSPTVRAACRPRRLIACGRSPANTHGGRSAGASSAPVARRPEPPGDRVADRRPQARPAGGRGPAGRRRRSSRARSTNRAGSWRPGGGPPGIRSARCTAISAASRVAAMRVDDQRAAGAQQPGALGQHGDVVRRRARGSRRPRTTSAQPSASGTASTEPRTGSIPCARPSCEAGQPEVDADVPVAQPGGVRAPSARRRRRDRPGRRARPVAGGMCSAREAANQCSIANPPCGSHHSSASSSYWAGSLRGSRLARSTRPTLPCPARLRATCRSRSIIVCVHGRAACPTVSRARRR